MVHMVQRVAFIRKLPMEKIMQVYFIHLAYHSARVGQTFFTYSLYIILLLYVTVTTEAKANHIGLSSALLHLKYG